VPPQTSTILVLISRVRASRLRDSPFRHAALVRGISVSTYLGTLVEAELKRRRTTPLGRTSDDESAPDTALEALATIRATIDELDDIAGRLARSAIATGASWNDVGASLRLASDAARSAYRAGPG
jgi:hypothetical protein